VSHVQLPPGEAMTNKADLPALAERHANLGTIKRDHAINLRQLSDKRFTVEVARGCQIRAAGKRAMPDPAGQAGNSPRSSKAVICSAHNRFDGRAGALPAAPSR
jgi:hypothetical protein